MGVEFNVKEESLRGEGGKSDEGAGGFSFGVGGTTDSPVVGLSGEKLA